VTVTVQRRLPPVLIFPVGWLLGVLVICLTNANGTVGTLVAIGWGLACAVAAALVAEQRCAQCGGEFLAWGLARVDPRCSDCETAQPARRSALAFIAGLGVATAVFAVIVFGSIYLIRAYDWVTWDPIGEVSDNGWGWYGCEKNDVQTVPNGSGLVSTVRRTECPGFFFAGDVTLSYFVFVNVAQQPITRHDLVLRYETTDAGWESPPQVTWTGARGLRIAVGSGDILRVTKQSLSSDGVRIEYAMSAALLPPALKYWQRPFW